MSISVGTVAIVFLRSTVCVCVCGGGGHTHSISDTCYATNERQLYEEKLHEETVLSKSLCSLLNKASHLTAFYALYSSLHLPVTPAQLMRPGIGRNASCAVGDFA